MSSGDGMTRGARHAVIFLFALSVLLAGANLLWTSHEVGRLGDVVARQRAAAGRQRQLVVRLRREVSAECQFNRDLSPLPVATSPATHKAPVLGVEIVADVRAAWRQAGCAGKLPPPSPSLLRWAAYYHRKVQR